MVTVACWGARRSTDRYPRISAHRQHSGVCLYSVEYRCSAVCWDEFPQWPSAVKRWDAKRWDARRERKVETQDDSRKAYG